MDYAVLCAHEGGMPFEIIEAINHVRLCKNMILPCELLGFCGNNITKEAREVFNKSTVKWKIKFDIVPKPYERLIKEWHSFVNWLKSQNLETTIVDFSSRA